MNTIILIQLIAAHLTGDFLLQSDKMCADKFSKDSSAKYDAVRRTRCRSTDCESPGTKDRKCSVLTFYNSLI